MKFLKQWVPSIVIGVILAMFIRSYVAEAMRVPTESMVPTIQVNDRLVVNKLLSLTTLRHGDMVVFYPPDDAEGNKYVKRLIGLPGDTVEIKDGALYRNGAKVEEPYIKEPMAYTFNAVTVPEGHYFFLGDNRNVSFDSHLWSTPFVAEDQLIGKVLFDVNALF